MPLYVPDDSKAIFNDPDYKGKPDGGTYPELMDLALANIMRRAAARKAARQMIEDEDDLSIGISLHYLDEAKRYLWGWSNRDDLSMKELRERMRILLKSLSQWPGDLPKNPETE